VLPFLSDSEDQLKETINIVKEYGKDFIFVDGLALFGKGPADCKMLYYKFLEKHYPDLMQKYKSLFRIFFAPSKDYQNEFEKTAKRLSEKYGIIAASGRNALSLYSSLSLCLGYITYVWRHVTRGFAL
jgi:hypothetical protein